MLTLLAGAAAFVVKVALLDRDALSLSRQRDASFRAAEAGIEYALWKLDIGAWLSEPKPLRFEAPFGTRGRFVVAVEEKKEGMVFLMTSTGWGDENAPPHTIHATASNPRDLTRYALNVYQFDYRTDSFFPDALTELGTENVGVAALVEELFTLPTNGHILLSARTDPWFWSVVPESESVVGSDGRAFRRSEATQIQLRNAERQVFNPKSEIRNPKSGGGEYAINYATGELFFHPEDAGKKVAVFYDYYHAVPRPPGPFLIGLPYPVVRENSLVLVAALDGRLMARDPVLPRLRSRYFLKEESATLSFSEHDASLPMRALYSFQGCRVTGSIRVNGNLRLDQRALLYLFRARGDAIAVSGRLSYGSQAKAEIVTEDGSRFNPLAGGATPLIREGLEPQRPPAVNFAYLREKADPQRGGDGLYFANFADREDPQDALERWQRLHIGQTYLPPGVEVDIGSVHPPNGLLYAEGNLRVRGALPPATRLTLVSAGAIYIEGNLQRQDDHSSLALIARDHICLNTSIFPPQPSTSGLPVEQFNVSINALLYAQRGTLGVIPRRGMNRYAVIRGAVNVNYPYPNREWARAFEGVEYFYDALLEQPETRPRHLVSLLSWRESGASAANAPDEPPSSEATESQPRQNEEREAVSPQPSGL